MFHVAGLHNGFWQEAHLYGMLFTKPISTQDTRIEYTFFLWFGRKPNVGHLKIFGAIAYSHIAPKLRKKLDPHSIKYIMVGYGESDGIKGY